MTAPGNSALVIGLMAAFVACAAYAIGRLHQRRQMDSDREDAYREGYDNASRRTFSLAAHLVARRRAARPAADSITDGPASIEPEPDPATQPLPPVSPPPSPRPASPPPAASSVPGPASSDPSPSTAAASPQVRTSPGGDALLRRSGVPGPTPRLSARRSSPPSEHNAPSLGFPVPPPAPPQIVGEPAAFGGVVYRPFPDPRLVGNAEPLPADRGSRHGVPSPRSHPSVPALPKSAVGEAADPSSTAAKGEPTSSGRHTVPDELVRSATYRLPADRVFRAKVPEPTGRAALPEEPTTRIGLPKPRPA
jgi:hypothetical protein